MCQKFTPRAYAHYVARPLRSAIRRLSGERRRRTDVLLDIEAIGLNRSEANFRRDRVRALPSGIGYEGSGRVRASNRFK
ncbi:hypothetical protein AB0C61_15360 [Streptomyces sp. NPDC048680]|uniref:hypothetical protein n=1 Tax=Streptomyces sp. NPDC048680 TaxID=3155492 RepID=UPI00342803AA